MNNVSSDGGMYGSYVQSISIPSTNQIHILTDCRHHFMFDCNDKLFKEIDCDRITLLNSNNINSGCLHLLYCEFNNQLMILGGDGSDHIFYCDIKQQSENNKLKWKLNSNIKMPHNIGDERYYDHVLFVDIIIVFYFQNYGNKYNDIWILDLFCETWHKSQYNVPKGFDIDSYFLKNLTDDNIHVLDFCKQNHSTVNLHDLLPKELIKSRRKHYNPLVIGFIREQENKNLIPTIPFVLKQLIAYYFPLFG